MSKKQRLFLYLFLLCIIMMLSAGGNPKSVSIVKVTGVVRLVGNEPFTELVITGSESQWYIAKNEWSKLHDLQHRTVTVQGEETVKDRYFANGSYAGVRRELRNIKIISVE